MSSLNNQIPVALPATSRLNLSCDHVTTMDFGRIQPVHYRHPIKGESINLAAVATVRPFPLACPTYGRMRLNLRHFFVPWRVVFPQFDSFINDTIGVNVSNSSVVSGSPVVQNNEFFDLLSVSPYSNVISNYQSGDPYDFKSGTNYYKFTARGKFLFKIFTSLGYAINFSKQDRTIFSALPILAYAKVYIDWYANQSYMDSSDVIFWKKKFAYNDPTGQLSLVVTDLQAFDNLVMRACYEPDYFIGAWDNPFAPNASQYSAITFADISGTALINNSTSGNGTPMMVQNASSSVTLGTQFLHDALKAITDYSKRHQLAGATNINRALAQYGFGVTALKMERSLYLGGSSIDIKTGAVYSTANTASSGNPSTLGDYAGNGFGQGNGGFSFQVDEHGLLISIASIMPSGGMYQGMDENNMVTLKHQFFNPEFDALGVQPIRRREVYVSRDSAFGTSGSSGITYDSAFGFVGRYGEKKRPRSWVSGDLVCPTWFNGGDSFHLMRRFDDLFFANTLDMVYHSNAFTQVEQDSYDRIFTIKNADIDKFIVDFHFDVHSIAPCHGLFESYEFEENGKKINIESNGAILN